MKKLMTYLLFVSAISFGQQDGFEEGNKYYAEEDYASAVESYEILIAEGQMSSDLFYNAGNAYYRNNELGKAIWAYEKALKVDPSNEHAKENLKFTIMQTVDGIDNSAPGIGTWLKGSLFGPSVNLWAYGSIICSILFSLSLLLYFRAKKRSGRNWGLLFGGVCGLLLLVTIITAHQHKMYVTDRSEGIIVSEEVEIKISPLERATVSFKLHAGTKVSLTGSNDDWLHVEVNGNSGWVPKEDIWEI